MPGFGQHQTTTFAVKQFNSHLLLKLAQLPANGLRGQMQNFGGLGNGTIACYRPEITQMLQVEFQVGHVYYR